MEAGSGSLGAASSESAARGVVGSGPAAVLAAVESAVVSGFGCCVVVRVCRWVWMVVEVRWERLTSLATMSSPRERVLGTCG